MHTESPEFLHKVYKTVIRAWGAPEHQAEAFADAILAGDLYGKDMQGMGIAMIDHLMMQHGQINMTADSQKENAPPPGPSSGIQPTGNSALFHIK